MIVFILSALLSLAFGVIHAEGAFQGKHETLELTPWLIAGLAFGPVNLVSGFMWLGWWVFPVLWVSTWVITVVSAIFYSSRS